MKALRFETNETVVLRYQLMEDSAPVDITGMAFKLAAKERHTDTEYKISPVTGTIDDAAEGKFSFEVTMPATPFSGVYSVVMDDTGAKRTVLTERGGAAIRVMESLVD